MSDTVDKWRDSEPRIKSANEAVCRHNQCRWDSGTVISRKQARQAAIDHAKDTGHTEYQINEVAVVSGVR